MKLITIIRPRGDGTVSLKGLDGNTYIFEREGADLSCEIAHKPTVVHAIQTGNFYPATEGDEAAADQLMADEDGAPDDVGAPPAEPDAPKPAAKRGRPKKVVAAQPADAPHVEPDQ